MTWYETILLIFLCSQIVKDFLAEWRERHKPLNSDEVAEVYSKAYLREHPEQ